MSTAVSRRSFLKTSGALVVSFSAASFLEPLALGQGAFDTHMSHVDPAKLDSWIAVGADGLVTAYTGKCDLGQGMFTVQTQLIAEELCVAIDRVRLIQCDTDVTPDQGTTSGSQSTPTNFNNRGLAQAAATARQALLDLASQRLNLPVDQLTASDGAITSGSNARVTYSDLIGGKKFNLTVNPAAKRRSQSEWTVLGKAVPSMDIKDIATARFEYVHNISVPGMAHGRVVRPPAVGAAVAGVDESSVKGIPGLIKVVVRKNFVGVVAEKQWQAVQAARQLKVNWTGGGGLPAEQDFYSYIRKQPAREIMLVDSQDTEQKISQAATVLKASYDHPYQAHASMGASCAVADVKGGKATVWSPTQSVYPTRAGVAALLGLQPDDVRVIFVRGSGCYGLNNADAVSFDAAMLSQAAGRPVRVQLSRSDEFGYENYGASCGIDQRVGLDASGNIIAWESDFWSTAHGNRPGYDHPGNVISGMLAGFEPETVTPKPFSPPTNPLRNGNNTVPSYVAGCAGGKCEGAGTVRSERVLWHIVNSPFFTGPLRSPLRLQNTFAHESFMDEICSHVKADPVEYRLRHLSDARLIAVVKAAAQAAKWETRPSPQANNPRSGIVRGRGMSCVAYEGDNGWVAMVAEVEVDQASGRVKPTRFVVAQDCGPISNPAGMRNQMEGGTLQGMSRALGEEVTWDDQKVTSVDWRSYHSLPLGIDVPVIESVLLNPTGVRATGAGETGITPVAGAIGNAIFDATGVRIRQVPFTPERVKAALQARG